MHKYWSKKPYNIVRDLILKYSSEKEIVLDPFCGGGTTGLVAVQMNRLFVGVDNDLAAIQTTLKRLHNA